LPWICFTSALSAPAAGLAVPPFGGASVTLPFDEEVDLDGETLRCLFARVKGFKAGERARLGGMAETATVVDGRKIVWSMGPWLVDRFDATCHSEADA